MSNPLRSPLFACLVIGASAFGGAAFVACGGSGGSAGTGGNTPDGGTTTTTTTTTSTTTTTATGGGTGTGGMGTGGGVGDAGTDASDAGVTLTIQEQTVAKSQSPLPGVPADTTNAYADNAAAAALGQKFFFDKHIAGPILQTPNDLGALNATGKVSCASCHVAPWGTDTRSYPNNLSLGVQWTTRNSPPIANVAFYNWFYWDGRSDSLWQQALLAGENVLQQGSDRLRITHAIYTYYKADYEAVFGPLDARFASVAPDGGSVWPPSGKPGVPAYDGLTGPATTLNTEQNIITQAFVNWGKAIAAYERLVVSRSAPWDKFVAGDNAAISQDAIRGYKLFVGKAYCINCHSGPLFSDSKIHNIGVPSPGGVVDHGRADNILKAIGNAFRGDLFWSDDKAAGATKIATQPDYSTPLDAGAPPADLGMFRTKHLRQIEHTGPYFHNGSSATLQDVMALYNAGGGDGGVGTLDMAFMNHVTLTQDEINQVIEFLKTLTGDQPDPKLLMDTSAP